MKIEPVELEFIQNVIKTAELIKIGGVSIESGRVRGMDEDRNAFILHTDGVPDFQFGALGINRLAEFTARLNMARSTVGFTIDATVDTVNESTFVRAVQMKAKGLKVDYRCANPLTIQSPKKLNDPFVYQFDLPPAISSFLSQGQSAYKTDSAMLVCANNQIKMVLADINGDKMEYVVTDDCIIDDSGDGQPIAEEFSFSYPIKTLLPLIKASPDATVYINTRGILRINVNKLDTHIWAIQ